MHQDRQHQGKRRVEMAYACLFLSKILVTFAVFKKHIGFYPMPSAIKAFAKELAEYKTAEGSVQFPHDKPLPLPDQENRQVSG
jgi:uncharacterized protein YdhG (YjbR/CyaY superfamily)